MGAIQSTINKALGAVATGIGATKVLKRMSIEKQELALKKVQDEKLARAKQRANLEKQRALYAEYKLRKNNAKAGMVKIKSKNEDYSIGGQKISDPELLKKLREAKNDK